MRGEGRLRVGPSQEKLERASSAGGFAPTSGPEGSGRSKLKRAGVAASRPGRGERGCCAVREGHCARALSCRAQASARRRGRVTRVAPERAVWGVSRVRSLGQVAEEVGTRKGAGLGWATA